MNKHVKGISDRMSLRDPQRESLEILARLSEMLELKKGQCLQEALATVSAEFGHFVEFEREFPSFCFALATGVGKTRLMGAFISYLYQAHAKRHYFVLAPNLTIYQKLIADFTPNTPKYVFQGIGDFAVQPPLVVTGEDYADKNWEFEDLTHPIVINIFNISKINSEVRGGRAPRVKRLTEYLGQSYFEYLSSLQDLVLLMDESHRYRASAGVRAINELKPILGLELTATPRATGGAEFRNVIYSYPLSAALADGFVKEAAVSTRVDFRTEGIAPTELEKIKLEDGVRIHENAKVELANYALQND